jgi:hypothetical protein
LKARQIKLEHLIPAALLAYVPLHVIEEGLFGFPAWAEANWRIPNYSVGKWLLHNVYFVFFLAVGYVLYRINGKKKFLFAGLGIVIWGLMNCVISHVACTLIFGYSPGFVTGLIFAAIAVLAFGRVREMGRLSWKTMLPAVLAGLFYWTVPILLFIQVDRALSI